MRIGWAGGPSLNGRWITLILAGTAVGAAAFSSVSPVLFAVLAAATLLGMAYAALYWPRATLVVAALTTLLDPAVAPRVLPAPLADGPIGISEPLLVVVGCVSVAGSAGRAGLPTAVRDPTVLLAGLFIAVSILSAIVNGTPGVVAGLGMLMTVDAIAILFVWRALRPGPETGVTAVLAIVAAVLVVALFGIAQVLLGPNLLGFPTLASLPGQVGRITSLLGNPNLMAPVLAFALPFPLFAAIRWPGRRGKAVGMVAAGILMLALILTLSRGAWTAAAIGLLAGSLAIDWRLLWPIVVVVGVGVGLTGLMPDEVTVPQPVQSPAPTAGPTASGSPQATPIPDPFRGLSSNEVRLYFLRDGLRIIEDNLILGVGPGRYGGATASIITSPVYEKYGTTLGRLRTVHNFWLHLAGETGVAGLAAFVAMISALIVRFARAARESDGARFVVLAGTATALVIAAINNATEMIFEGNIPAILIWLTVGVASSLAPDPRLGILTRIDGGDR